MIIFSCTPPEGLQDSFTKSHLSSQLSKLKTEMRTRVMRTRETRTRDMRTGEMRKGTRRERPNKFEEIEDVQRG
jgi:hypothetical protein